MDPGLFVSVDVGPLRDPRLWDNVLVWGIFQFQDCPVIDDVSSDTSQPEAHFRRQHGLELRGPRLV